MVNLRGVAVSFRNVRKQFGEVTAVNDVSLEVRPGELLCLLGPSGCGKTTMLRLLAGLERLDGGSIHIDGRQVAGPGHHVPPEKRRVGMVFQDFALFPHLTVAANVAYGLNGRRDQQKVHRLLAMAGLEHCAQRLPHQLSGGQQQRLALIRALAPGPDVMLLDEPFSNLDQQLRRQLRHEVRSILEEAGATSIFVTHDQEEALSMADRVAIMWEGRLIQVGTPEEVYRYPAHRDIAGFLGEANFLPGHAQGGRVTCELGVFPAPAWLQGPVEVMFRPEAIKLAPLTKSSDGIRAAVASSRFFGHDRLVNIRLPSGQLLEVRIMGTESYAAGQSIGIQVEGAPMIFLPPTGETVTPNSLAEATV